MYFDCASRSPTEEREVDPQDHIARIGIVFISSDNALIVNFFSHTEMPKQHVITKIDLAWQISISNLTIYNDSELIVKQQCNEYNVKNEPRSIKIGLQVNFLLMTPFRTKSRLTTLNLDIRPTSLTPSFTSCG